MVHEGRLRALTITGDKRDTIFPGISTMNESGYTEFEAYAWTSVFVRADTPDDIVSKLAAALASEEGKTSHAKNPGAPLPRGPKEIGEFQMRAYLRLKKAADAAGIKPE